MTILGALQQARVTASSIQSPEVPLSSSSILEFLGVEPNGSGKSVTEISVLGLSGVFRAVEVTAGVSASLPLNAFVQAGAHRVPATSQGSKILQDPHPDMTPFELWETAHVHRALWGNFYARKLRDGLGIVRELWPIHPGRMKVGRESETGQKVYLIDGKETHVGDRNILHIPAMGYDGICGVSPVRAAQQSLGLAMAAEEYGAKLFGSGNLASGILQTEQRLTPTQADALAERWRAKRTGLKNAHDTIILDRGAKFEQLTIPPQDAQFLESRRFQVTEICRWFGLPPFLMFETEKSTSWGTGLEQQALGWVVFDLRRKLVSFEQRLNKQLLLPDEYAKHNVEGLLRGDSAARAQFYRTLWELGAFSTNEIRALEDRGPVKGGDVRYRPLNMGQLGEFDTTTQGVPANA